MWFKFPSKEGKYHKYITVKEIVNFKSLTKLFIANLLSFNFDAMKCYNL